MIFSEYAFQLKTSKNIYANKYHLVASPISGNYNCCLG